MSSLHHFGQRWVVLLVINLGLFSTGCQTSYEKSYLRGLELEKEKKNLDAIEAFANGCAKLLHRDYYNSCQKMKSGIVSEFDLIDWDPALKDPGDKKFLKAISRKYRRVTKVLKKVLSYEVKKGDHPDVEDLTAQLKKLRRHMIKCFRYFKKKACHRFYTSYPDVFRGIDYHSLGTIGEKKLVNLFEKKIKDISLKNHANWKKQLIISSVSCQAGVEQGCESALIIYMMIVKKREARLLEQFENHIRELFVAKCSSKNVIVKDVKVFRSTCDMLAANLEKKCRKEDLYWCRAFLQYAENADMTEKISDWRLKLCEFGEGNACYKLASYYRESNVQSIDHVNHIYTLGCQAKHVPSCLAKSELEKKRQEKNKRSQSKDSAMIGNAPENLDAVREVLFQDVPCLLAFTFYDEKKEKKITKIWCVTDTSNDGSGTKSCRYGLYFLKSKKFKILKPKKSKDAMMWAKEGECANVFEDLVNQKVQPNSMQTLGDRMIDLKKSRGKYLILYASEQQYAQWFTDQFKDAPELLGQ